MAEDDAIDLLTWLRTTPRKSYRQGVAHADELRNGFPATREALYSYQLLIHGSLPASALDETQHRWLEAFVAERGGSVLALAGRQALTAGGWDVKPLAQALPVALERSADEAPAYASANTPPNPRQPGWHLASPTSAAWLETAAALADAARAGRFAAPRRTQARRHRVAASSRWEWRRKWRRKRTCAAIGHAALRVRQQRSAGDRVHLALAHAHLAG